MSAYFDNYLGVRIVAELSGMCPKGLLDTSEESLVFLKGDEKTQEDQSETKSTMKAVADQVRAIDWQAYQSLVRWSASGAVVVAIMVFVFNRSIIPMLALIAFFVALLDVARIWVKLREIDNTPEYNKSPAVRFFARASVLDAAWNTAPLRYLFYFLFFIPVFGTADMVLAGFSEAGLQQSFFANVWSALLDRLITGQGWADYVAGLILGLIHMVVWVSLITLFWGLLRRFNIRPSVAFDLPPPTDPI